MKGQINGAISEFQEALRLEPDFTEARSNLERGTGNEECFNEPMKSVDVGRAVALAKASPFPPQNGRANIPVSLIF